MYTWTQMLYRNLRESCGLRICCGAAQAILYQMQWDLSSRTRTTFLNSLLRKSTSGKKTNGTWKARFLDALLILFLKAHLDPQTEFTSKKYFHNQRTRHLCHQFNYGALYLLKFSSPGELMKFYHRFQ